MVTVLTIIFLALTAIFFVSFAVGWWLTNHALNWWNTKH